MNGRLYDPAVGRFISPDNFVQAPGNSQSYNRYSYCLNNPLKYNDPSGWVMCPGSGGFTYSPTNQTDFSGYRGDPNDGYGIGSTGWGGGNGGVLPFDYTTIYDTWLGYGDWPGGHGDCNGGSRSKSYAGFWGPLLASISNSASYRERDAYKGPTPQSNDGHIYNLCGIKGLNIDLYYDYSPDASRTDGSDINGGVVIIIDYTSPVIDSGAKWSQLVTTTCDSNNNSDCIPSIFWDNMGKGGIYYGGDQGTSDHNSWMDDNPNRRSGRGDVLWTAVTRLIQNDKVLVTVNWGFITHNGKTTKIPISAF